MGVGVTILSSPPLPFNCCGNREIAAFLKKKKGMSNPDTAKEARYCEGKDQDQG